MARRYRYEYLQRKKARERARAEREVQLQSRSSTERKARVVAGDSMLNTLHDGDNLIIDKISYRFREPERYEIIDTDKYGQAAEPIKLDEDEYFVLGDNRNESADSRVPNVGILHRDELIGRAWVRIWPADSFGIISHK